MMNTEEWNTRIEYAQADIEKAMRYLHPIDHHEIRAICQALDALCARLRTFGDGLELAEGLA